MRSLIPALCLGLLAAQAGRADITPDNAPYFLRTGELSFKISVSPGDIDWIEDEQEAAERAGRLEAVLARNPRNLRAARELIELYRKGCRESEAAETARRSLPAFRERCDHDGDEASAVHFTRALLAAQAREEYGAAYRALQPFLESGRAGPETCTTAIEVCLAGNNPELAGRIAGRYLQVYPRSAELHHLLYRISCSDRIQAAAVAAVQGSAREVLAEAGLENFLAGLLEVINSEIDTASLLRAIELEPGSYRYSLDAAMFEAIVLCISRAALQVLAEDSGDALEDLLLRTGTAMLTPLREHLENAKDARPRRDIQVFLVEAMAAICLGDFEAAAISAATACRIRPDLPAGYDALLCSVLVPFMEDGADIDAKTRDRTLAIYETKIDRTGGSPADYSAVAGLWLTEYVEAGAPAGDPLLGQALEFTEKALAADPRYLPARLQQATLHIIAGRYARAVTILEGIPAPEDTGLAGMLLHNLGIARLLDGQAAAGRAALEEAARLQPEYSLTLEALREIGAAPEEP